MKKSIKPENVLDLGPVHIDALKQYVKMLPEQLWEEETKRRDNNYFCFGQTQHIVFIFAQGVHPRNYVIKPIWNIVREKFDHVIKEAVSGYGYQNGQVVKAMLARLKAGGKIDRHIDYVKRDRLVHKIHVPLVTDPQVNMCIDDRFFHLEAGKAYEVNNLVYHSVDNASSTDRIHFIFEYYHGPI